MDLFPTNFSVFVATRESWPPGSTNCGNVQETDLKEPDHLVTLAQEFWDTDQVLFARGLLPRGWLLASELAECSEVRMWESSGFKVCVSDNVLIASDGSGGSRETPKSVRQVAFGVATFSLQPLSDTSFKLLRTGFLGGQVPGRQTIPRSELWGAIQILSRVDEKSNIQIPIDAKHVTRGITRRSDLEQGPYGDLSSILFQLIDERSGVTDVTKSQLEDVGHQSSRKTISASITCLQIPWQTWWLRRRPNDCCLT